MPALKGKLIYTTHRGQLIVRSWPRKPKGPPSPKQKAQRDWFKVARQMAKYVDPLQIVLAKKVTRNTGLYPDDLILMAMAGNLFAAIDDGEKLYTKWQPEIRPVFFQGVRLQFISTKVLTPGVAWPVQWTNALLMTADFWSVSDKPNIVIPAGVTVGQFKASTLCSASTNPEVTLHLREAVTGLWAGNQSLSRGINECEVNTGPIAVSAGQKWSCEITTDLAATVALAQRNTFTFEVLEAA